MDYFFNPVGIPGNPLDGNLGQDSSTPLPWWMKGTKRPLESNRAKQLENPGITNAGSSGKFSSASSKPETPEQIITPEPVSATDPAYSMHPLIKMIFSGLNKVPAADTEASPWVQSPFLQKGKNLTRSNLLTALGIPGLDLPYSDQGAPLK